MYIYTYIFIYICEFKASLGNIVSFRTIISSTQREYVKHLHVRMHTRAHTHINHNKNTYYFKPNTAVSSYELIFFSFYSLGFCP